MGRLPLDPVTGQPDRTRLPVVLVRVGKDWHMPIVSPSENSSARPLNVPEYVARFGNKRPVATRQAEELMNGANLASQPPLPDDTQSLNNTGASERATPIVVGLAMPSRASYSYSKQATWSTGGTSTGATRPNAGEPPLVNTFFSDCADTEAFSASRGWEQTMRAMHNAGASNSQIQQYYQDQVAKFYASHPRSDKLYGPNSGFVPPRPGVPSSRVTSPGRATPTGKSPAVEVDPSPQPGSRQAGLLKPGQSSTPTTPNASGRVSVIGPSPLLSPNFKPLPDAAQTIRVAPSAPVQRPDSSFRPTAKR